MLHSRIWLLHCMIPNYCQLRSDEKRTLNKFFVSPMKLICQNFRLQPSHFSNAASIVYLLSIPFHQTQPLLPLNQVRVPGHHRFVLSCSENFASILRHKYSVLKLGTPFSICGNRCPIITPSSIIWTT